MYTALLCVFVDRTRQGADIERWIGPDDAVDADTCIHWHFIDACSRTGRRGGWPAAPAPCLGGWEKCAIEDTFLVCALFGLGLAIKMVWESQIISVDGVGGSLAEIQSLMRTSISLTKYQ